MNVRLSTRLQNKNQPYYLGGAARLMVSVFLAQRVSYCHGFRAVGWKSAFPYNRQPLTTTTTRITTRTLSSSKSMLAARSIKNGTESVTSTTTTARNSSRLACSSGGRLAPTTTPSLRCCPSSKRTTRTKALYSTTTELEKKNKKENAIGETNNEIRDATLYQQFKDLSIQIRMHDEMYYTGGNSTDDDVGDDDDGHPVANSSVPIISDDEFDALVRREEELGDKHPEFVRAWGIESGLGKAAIRSGRVGTMMATEASDGDDDSPNKSVRLKRRHLSPMLSLDNVLNEDQLHSWLRRVVKATNELEMHTEAKTDSDEKVHSKSSSISTISVITEPKLDGVSMSLRYEALVAAGSSTTIDSNAGDDTKPMTLDLQWASTRGDGKVGQDVTAAAKQMPGIPSQIELPSSYVLGSSLQNGVADESIITVEVRGEVVLPRSEFLRIRHAEAAAIAQQQMEEEEIENNIKLELISVNNITANVTINNGEGTGNETQKATKSKTISFSNPRNAASGILLRKESDDPDEESQSRELRSLLRFYAYDSSGLERMETQKGEESLEMDGTIIRQQLSDWGFPLALPAAITEIEWNRNDLVSTINETSEDDESGSTFSWDDWFQDAIIKEQIRPIMNYFSALEKHRERIQEEDANLPSPMLSSRISQKSRSKDSKRKKSSPVSVYKWGDFDVDGCVHKVSQASIKSAMGYSMKSPKWAIAHKFPAQSAVSRLLDIIIQVGRTGALTPVAILEPTEVGGVTVQRATLHNFGHMQDVLGTGLDAVDGSEVDGDNKNHHLARIPKYEPLLLQRAGDVIPQVVRRIQSHAESSTTASIDEHDSSAWISLAPPERCPFCSSPVSYETSGSSASSVGQVIRCSGPPLLCPPRAVTSLKHAFSRDALDLTGLSEARIQQLMDADLLRYPSDVFKIGDTEWESVAALPGWGGKSCKNLRETSGNIASNGIALSRFIYSLGIRHVGKHTSELVAESYGSIEAFVEALDSAASYQEPPVVLKDEGEGTGKEKEETESSSSPEHQWRPFPRLENKLGIGPVMIESLLAFARTEELTNATKDLAKALNILEQDVVINEEEPSPGTNSDDTEVDSTTNNSNSSNRPWKGFRVVFTGSLGDGLTRSKAQEIAKQLGAKATPGSVSKSTDLVVYGEKGGKKLKQARELGISTVEADEFVRLAKEHGDL